MPEITTSGGAVIIRFTGTETESTEPTKRRLTPTEANTLAETLRSPESRQDFAERLGRAASEVAINYRDLENSRRTDLQSPDEVDANHE